MSVWLRDVGNDGEPYWVPCAKGDTGAVAFEPKPKLFTLPEIEEERERRRGMTKPYAVSEDLLRQAVLDDSLSRGALQVLATARTLPATPEILEWSKRVMARADD